jgi:iron complex outermembrane receptor protein
MKFKKGMKVSAFLSGAILLVSGSQSASAQKINSVDASSDSGEIVVTGLKRGTTLLDAPVAVTVFTAEEIVSAGISRPEDFLALTSNVTFISSNQEGEFFVNIRGQSSVRYAESAVAVVIDGVQLSTLNEFNGELFDIEQIEVLKGPQSALYGRNATAGAIIINSRKPKDYFEGNLRGTLGNWNTAKIHGSVSGPLIEGKLRFAASGSVSGTDGPYTNITTGEKVHRWKQQAGRIRLNYEDGPLNAQWVTAASYGIGGGIAFNAQVAGSTVAGVFVDNVDANRTDIPFIADVQGENEQNKFSTSFKIDYDFGDVTLTSVSSYAKISDRYQAKNFPYADYSRTDTDFGAFEAAFGDRTQKFRVSNESFIQELRLTSDDDMARLRWQIGIYFQDSDRSLITQQGQSTGGGILPNFAINGPASTNPTDFFDVNAFSFRNYAPFGNVQFDITESLELAVAVRYDTEKRKIRNQTPDIPNLVTGASTYNQCVLNTGRPVDQCRESATFKQFQPKINLVYSFPDNLGSIYATYGKGFKSGGFNPIGSRAILLSAPGANPDLIFAQDTYRKETTDAYEIGFKTRFWDNRVSLNGAVFMTKIRNGQQYEFFPNSGIQVVSSIDRQTVKGVEADITIDATEWLKIFGGGGIIDANIKELRSAPSLVGNDVPYIQDYNYFIGYGIDAPISDKINFINRIEYTSAGPVWYDSSNLSGTQRNAVGLVNGRIGVSGDNWEIVAWSRNLFNKRYNSETVPLLSILAASFKAPTRSWGIELSYDF